MEVTPATTPVPLGYRRPRMTPSPDWLEGKMSFSRIKSSEPLTKDKDDSIRSWCRSMR